MALSLQLYLRLKQEKTKLNEIQTQLTQSEQANIQAQAQSHFDQQTLQKNHEHLNEYKSKNQTLEQQTQALKQNQSVLMAQVSSLNAKNNHLLQSKQESFEREQSLNNRLDTLNAQFQKVQNEFTELQTKLSEKESNFEEQKQQFSETKQQLALEFEQLANKIFTQKSQDFSQNSQQSLNHLLQPFKEQIEGFQKRVNEVHDQTLKGHTALDSEIKKILNIGLQMSDEANNLSKALKGDKKLAGNWGEFQLEKTLEMAGLIKDEHYQAQAFYKTQGGKTQYPDFVINLPDNKQMILDSKVSLVAYEQAMSAQTPEELTISMESHVKAIKNHIDGLSKKDYDKLPGINSPSFVLMFMPIEPAYIEAMKYDSTLFGYGYQKNVVLVSHTTLMPILRTVANLWMMEKGNQDARLISERAADIYNNVCLISERLNKVGQNIGTLSHNFNDTVKAISGKQGLFGKVDKFKQLSTKANKSFTEITSVDLDISQVEAITDEQ